MFDVILVRYGEIGLKGKNRASFEDRLVDNIRRAASGSGARVRKAYGRIIVESSQDESFSRRLIDRVASVFGVVSVSPAIRVSLEMDALETGAKKLIAADLATMHQDPVRFKVEARRANKRFPLTSPEINGALGGSLLSAFPRLSVDVHTPEITLHVEVRDEAAYLFTQIVPGPGGLPVGTSSRGLILLSGGIDSPVAGWLAMKRGIALEAIHFHSFPYTSDRSKEKALDLARTLGEYGLGSIPVHVVHFTEVQRAIKERIPRSMGITVMRRMMFRIATRLARGLGIPALITGESVGQVASQTLESMAAINAVTTMPVLRPLVTMDKEEIVRIAERIGTYEISILPYEDCCTIFVPDHPETKPRLDRVEAAEAALDVEGLVEEALARTERIEASRSVAGLIL